MALRPEVYWLFSEYLELLPIDLVNSAFEVLGGASNAAAQNGYKDCKKILSMFFMPVLEAFGEDRILWASGFGEL